MSDNKVVYNADPGDTVPYREEWTDTLGFMTGALDWAKVNLYAGQTVYGVRFAHRAEYADRARLANASKPIDLSALTHPEVFAISKQRDSGTFPQVTASLDLFNGNRVVMSDREIFVFQDSTRVRVKDAIEKYRRYYSPSEGQVWKKVAELTRSTFQHLESCPLYVPDIVKQLKELSSTTVGYIYGSGTAAEGPKPQGGQYNYWELLLPNTSLCLLQHDGVEATATMARLYSHLYELMQHWITLRYPSPWEEQQPDLLDRRANAFVRVLEIWWLVNQELPVYSRMSWGAWKADMLDDVIRDNLRKGWPEAAYVTDQIAASEEPYFPRFNGDVNWYQLS